MKLCAGRVENLQTNYIRVALSIFETFDRAFDYSRTQSNPSEVRQTIRQTIRHTAHHAVEGKMAVKSLE